MFQSQTSHAIILAGSIEDHQSLSHMEGVQKTIPLSPKSLQPTIFSQVNLAKPSDPINSSFANINLSNMQFGSFPISNPQINVCSLSTLVMGPPASTQAVAHRVNTQPNPPSPSPSRLPHPQNHAILPTPTMTNYQPGPGSNTHQPNKFTSHSQQTHIPLPSPTRPSFPHNHVTRHQWTRTGPSHHNSTQGIPHQINQKKEVGH